MNSFHYNPQIVFIGNTLGKKNNITILHAYLFSNSKNCSQGTYGE